MHQTVIVIFCPLSTNFVDIYIHFGSTYSAQIRKDIVWQFSTFEVTSLNNEGLTVLISTAPTYQ